MDADAGNLLRRAREAAGLSVREAAARLGLSPATVSDAERGHDPRPSTLRAHVGFRPRSLAAVLAGRIALRPSARSRSTPRRS